MLNIKETENQKIYFVSDLHWNHARDFVYKARGFNSVKEHNDAIINSINTTVRDTDIIFNLGDLILNSTIEQFEELIASIKCQNMYLLFGNHPNKHLKEIYLPCIKSYLGNLYKDGDEYYPIRYKNIIYLGHYAEVILGGHFCVLCHYPLISWNNMKQGAFMLHGHEHSGVPDHLPEGTNGKILDLSWDYFKRPVSLSEVKQIMQTKNIVSVGHH